MTSSNPASGSTGDYLPNSLSISSLRCFELEEKLFSTPVGETRFPVITSFTGQASMTVHTCDPSIFRGNEARTRSSWPTLPIERAQGQLGLHNPESKIRKCRGVSPLPAGYILRPQWTREPVHSIKAHVCFLSYVHILSFPF